MKTPSEENRVRYVLELICDVRSRYRDIIPARYRDAWSNCVPQVARAFNELLGVDLQSRDLHRHVAVVSLANVLWFRTLHSTLCCTPIISYLIGWSSTFVIGLYEAQARQLIQAEAAMRMHELSLEPRSSE